MQQGIVIFAKNKKRLSTFYQEALGLQAVECESSHDLLRGHGYEIVVHAMPRKYASQVQVLRPATGRFDTAIKPTFVVQDLEHVRAVAKATGGHLKDMDLAWHFRGHTVLDGWDPEGNVVQFKMAE